MSDKERLEEIKSRVWKEHCTYAVGDDSSREGYRYILSDEDYHWLMEQVERVQELETTVDFYQSALRDADRRVQELESELNKQIEIGYKFEGEVYDLAKENKRYREALNTIITLWIASTDATDDTWLAHEMSETARKVLEGEE